MMGGIIENAGEVQLRLPAVWGHWTSTWFQIIHKSSQEYIDNTQYPKSTHNSQKCHNKVKSKPKISQNTQKYSRIVVTNITNIQKYPKNLKMFKISKNTIKKLTRYPKYHKILENTYKCSEILENTPNILK